MSSTKLPCPHWLPPCSLPTLTSAALFCSQSKATLFGLEIQATPPLPGKVLGLFRSTGLIIAWFSAEFSGELGSVSRDCTSTASLNAESESVGAYSGK